MSKKGSASAPVSPCNGAKTASVLTELHNSNYSRAAAAAAVTPASGVITEYIILDSDTPSDAVETYRSAPVSPLHSAAARDAGLHDAGGVGRGERSVDELTLLRSLFADPARPAAPWPSAAHRLPAAAPPAQRVPTHFSLEDACVSSLNFCGTAALRSSPLPLRERLRHRVGSGQDHCAATHSIPNSSLAGHSNVCRDFGEPGIAGVGGNIWHAQDSQPNIQANAGLEMHAVLGYDQLHEANHCISLVTP